MFNNMSKVTQGCVGLGAAIAYFTRQGCVVLLPLVDNQPYDFAVEENGEIKKVQVKTTGYKDPKAKDPNFIVTLRSIRANKTKNVAHKFNKDLVDYVFVLTSEGNEYLFPSQIIEPKSTLSLCEAYEKYKINGR
jgi:hypothetical protein